MTDVLVDADLIDPKQVARRLAEGMKFAVTASKEIVA